MNIFYKAICCEKSDSMNSEDFYTFSGYIKKDDSPLTASMEDYVEMIYRLSLQNGFTRINDLSNALNVQPPSATKMVQKLAELGYGKYERYGVIMLTEKGKEVGQALLKRHKTIEELLKFLGVEKSVLEETEKIEHSINEETLKCIWDFMSFIKECEDVKSKFEEYRRNK